MTAYEAATRGTTNFIHYKSNVIDASGVNFEVARRFDSRIHSAFEMGEPVWMIADEIKLRASAPRKTKTPRQLAIKVIMVGGKNGQNK